jgi:hypothetical protein
MRYQKKRASVRASPSRMILTFGLMTNGSASSSRKACMILPSREANSSPLVLSLICDISTFSREFVPNSASNRIGSADRPTHRFISIPLSSKKMPSVASLSTLRFTDSGNRIRSRPAKRSFSDSSASPSRGCPAASSMSWMEYMCG